MKYLAGIAFTMLLAACSSYSPAVPPAHGGSAHARSAVTYPVSKTSSVGHIVVIMMENRSFDSYFGTFPGANGIPQNVNCNPDPQTQQCIYPYHDTATLNYGGPHETGNMITDLDGGKLDGFIISAESMPGYADPNPDEVMGYHTCDELPVYCRYARTYTLADNHFAATTAGSTIVHLYLVSGWSAQCTRKGDPMSCSPSLNVNFKQNPDYAWTDLTWLLHAHGISWGYYIYPNHLAMEDDQGDGEGPHGLGLSGWNPLPAFDDVSIDLETKNIQTGSNFVVQAASGMLPAVSWVIPPFGKSDHPPSLISHGQKWVKEQIDAVMSGPDWPSTVILLTWDEWGGFYDHVVPPVIDGQGYGFRTPLIVIGPMVKRGYIDHQLLSSDAYLKFIEDTFLNGERIDSNDGRPDSRPDVRETSPGLGDLRNDLQ